MSIAIIGTVIGYSEPTAKLTQTIYIANPGKQSYLIPYEHMCFGFLRKSFSESITTIPAIRKQPAIYFLNIRSSADSRGWNAGIAGDGIFGGFIFGACE